MLLLLALLTIFLLFHDPPICYGSQHTSQKIMLDRNPSISFSRSLLFFLARQLLLLLVHYSLSCLLLRFDLLLFDSLSVFLPFLDSPFFENPKFIVSFTDISIESNL